VMDNMGIIAITVSMQYRNELMEREKFIMWWCENYRMEHWKVEEWNYGTRRFE
jgi:hypothetical protein